MDDKLQVLTVTRLVNLIKETVEENFVQVVVEGEISNLARPSSGHYYFTLKDDTAQIRAVMFRHLARLNKFTLENGLHVNCRGHVSLYRQRGELQLVVDMLQPVGAGSLQLAFDQLKQKLATEGLFTEERKKTLPLYPGSIGVVTSATGAAIHDILRVLQRRGGGLDVKLWPVRVQGEDAAKEIVGAIEGFNRLCPVDVLIVGRGGGPLEDLWAFNEEIVARAIAASDIPVISAVGHEVDFTIADMVADLRAATPSAAAEQVTKSRMELELHVDQLKIRLANLLMAKLHLLTTQLDGLRHRLVSPEQKLEIWRYRLQGLATRLSRSSRQYLVQHSASIASLVARLELLSPLKTLERGYSIVLQQDGAVVRDSRQLQSGENLDLRFSSGRACVKVEATDP